MAKPDPTPTFLEFHNGQPVVKSTSSSQMVTAKPDWIDEFLADRAVYLQVGGLLS